MHLSSLLGAGVVIGVVAFGGCGDAEKRGVSTQTGGEAGANGDAGSGLGGAAGANAGAGSGVGGAEPQGGGGAANTDPVRVTLDGAVQKGPFVEGSSVQVSTVDAFADSTGQVFSTQTNDDLGSFAVKLGYQGGISVESTGYYY